MLAYDGPSFMPRTVSSGEINRAHRNNTNKLVAGKAGQPIVCTNNTHGNLELVQQLQDAFDNAICCLLSSPVTDDHNDGLTCNSTKQTDSISDHPTTKSSLRPLRHSATLFSPLLVFFSTPYGVPRTPKLNSNNHKHLPLVPKTPVFKNWICRHKRFFLEPPCVCLGI